MKLKGMVQKKHFNHCADHKRNSSPLIVPIQIAGQIDEPHMRSKICIVALENKR